MQFTPTLPESKLLQFRPVPRGAHRALTSEMRTAELGLR